MSILSSEVLVLLNAVTGTGAGTVVADTTGFTDGPVMQIVITGTATVQIQEALDRTNWTTMASVTSTDAYVLPAKGCYYRANVSAITGGSVTVLVGPGITTQGQLGMTRPPTVKSGGPS